MNLSKEIATQDNRATRLPYFFQVQEDEEIYVPDGCGEEVWISEDGCILITESDIKEAVFEWNDWDLNNEDHLKKYDELDSCDIDDILYKHYKKVNVDTEHKYSNAFFTEKACRKHIEQNKHNLCNPKTYLYHAYRNEEMEDMFRFLKEIGENIK